ncbi:MAG: translation initiation factor [Chlorobi bacterium]|nr:translation initiation factor [Chlorobiota bacterium]
MAKKKTLKDLSALGGLVYSTDSGTQAHIRQEQKRHAVLEAHFSKKGRGGKTVTVVKGFPGSEQELKALARKIKSKLGVGGNVKNGEMIIQGDNRDKVVTLLEAEGYRVKKVGG